MMRATPEDAKAIEAFLSGHLDYAMFPLMNLRRFGIDGPQPRSMSFWTNSRNGQITDVLGVSREGMIMPILTGETSADLQFLPGLLAGRTIMGGAGPTAQVRAILAALGLSDIETTINGDEPHFALDLADFSYSLPDNYRLGPVAAPVMDLAISWRADYLAGLGFATGAQAQARRDIEAQMQADSHRFLFDGERPVAYTGFNAAQPEAVQVGGVFVPSEQRSRGYGRIVVGAHLAEAKAQGVQRAILSAANAAAERCYRSLGFQQVGKFTLTLFKTPQLDVTKAR